MKKNKSAKKNSGGGMVLRPGGGGFSPFLPTPVKLALREVERLVSKGEDQAALNRLEALNHQYPGTSAVLEMLLMVAIATEDSGRCLIALEALHRLHPEDTQVATLLPTVYLINGFPALAIRAMTELENLLQKGKGFDKVQRAEAERILQSREGLYNALIQDITTAGLEGEAGFEIAWRTEQQRAYLLQRDYESVKRLGEEMLALNPSYAPALNNIAQAAWLQGNLSEATSACERVLESAPDNIHALANLSRFQFIQGKTETAKKTVMALRSSTAVAADRNWKLMEAFVCLKEDQAVLDVFKKAFPGVLTKMERHGKGAWKPQVSELEYSLDDGIAESQKALLHHLAAVASLRLGKENVARGLWRRALEIEPDSEAAKSNLIDMDLPLGERNGPWAYSLTYWLSESVLISLRKEGRRLFTSNEKSQRGDNLEEVTDNLVQEFLTRFPQLLTTFPILLDQGDPMGRELALRLAMEAKLPETDSLLHDFALGTSGTDQIRMQAAQAAVQAGLIEAGNVRMFLRGNWQETILLAFEITNEPSESSHSSEVQELLEQGMAAHRSGNKAKAEQLLRLAVEKEPKSPTLWNNLAGAISEQGRTEESEEILERIYANHPDYFFGRTNMALIHLRRGELEPVRELLDPLLRLKKLHITEFSALAMAEVKFQLAENSIEGAQSWLDMLAAADLESPQLADLQHEIDMHRLKQSVEMIVSQSEARKARKKKVKAKEEPQPES
jgi:Flp pilus assembly protein TadD